MQLVTKYMDPGFTAIYFNATFRSKLMFGLEDLGGSPLTLISQIQKLQDQAAKLALPPKYYNETKRQREIVLGWLTIRQEIQRAHSLRLLG